MVVLSIFCHLLSILLLLRDDQTCISLGSPSPVKDTSSLHKSERSSKDARYELKLLTAHNGHTTCTVKTASTPEVITARADWF